MSTVNPLLRFVTLYSATSSFAYTGLWPYKTVNILRNPSQMVENSLTVSAVVGSYLATRKAVVDVSTVLKILLRMKGFEEKRRY